MQEACNTIRVHDQKSSTAPAAYLLCRMGYISDVRIQKIFWRLLETQYTDGGWRCNKFFFGHGPETEHSNAWPALIVLERDDTKLAHQKSTQARKKLRT